MDAISLILLIDYLKIPLCIRYCQSRSKWSLDLTASSNSTAETSPIFRQTTKKLLGISNLQSIHCQRRRKTVFTAQWTGPNSRKTISQSRISHPSFRKDSLQRTATIPRHHLTPILVNDIPTPSVTPTMHPPQYQISPPPSAQQPTSLQPQQAAQSASPFPHPPQLHLNHQQHPPYPITPDSTPTTTTP